ncbi:MAG: methyltransferase [Deltaproteobacteria bacterium]|nr:methyltransferase [Deltaproteobacteria bacterium]MBW2067661.1 methyltransferase [Deltaproteobacteria bacterium]
MNLSRDTLFNGKLVIYQDSKGYRFAIDSILLAGLTPIYDGENVADLGCGSGVVGLICLFRNPTIKVAAVEIQPELVALARKNTHENRMEDKIQVYHGDVRTVDKILKPATFDAVVTNPPYRRANSGRLNPDEQKAIARHEIYGTIDDFLAAGYYLLKSKGRMAVVYPAQRLDDLIIAANRNHLRLKYLRLIYSYADSPARLVFGLFRKNAGQELSVGPPFVIYANRKKEYTPEMKALYDAS